MMRLLMATAATLLLLAALHGRTPDDDPGTGQVPGPVPMPACDNKCRMRKDFMFLTTSQCVHFDLSVCFLCVNNNLCTDTGSTLGFDNCLPGELQTTLTYDLNCLPVCPFWTGSRSVQANIFAQGTETTGIRRSTCQWSPPGPPVGGGDDPPPVGDPTQIGDDSGRPIPGVGIAR